MGTRLHGELQVYEIRAWHEMQPGDVSRPFFNVSSAAAFLRAFMHDPFAMTALRELTASTFWASSIYACSNHDIIQQLAEQLVAGRLCLVPLKRIERYLPAGGTRLPTVPNGTQQEEPPGSGTSVPEEHVATNWITFRLIDDDTEAPIAGVELRVTLPDGVTRTYATDHSGQVHLTDLPDGTCDLEQLLDDEAFEVVQYQPGPPASTP